MRVPGSVSARSSPHPGIRAIGTAACLLLAMFSPSFTAAPRAATPPPVRGGAMARRSHPSRSSAQQDSIYAFVIAMAQSAPQVTVIHELRGRRIGALRLGAAWGRAFVEALDLEGRKPSAAECRNVCRDSIGMPDVIRLEYRNGLRVAELRYRLGYGQLGVGDSTVCVDVRDRHRAFLGILEQALPRDNRIKAAELCPAVDDAGPKAAGTPSHTLSGREPGAARTPGSSSPAFDEADPRIERRANAVVKVPPTYPDNAREAGVDGTVIVRVLVAADSSVREVRVGKSIQMLDKAALVAVQQWRFAPALVAGKPVDCWLSVPVRFSLH
jgi:TonB family protein